MVRMSDTKRVWINSKGGRHYHIEGCWMIDSPDYKEINFGSVDKERYRACVCVERYLRGLPVNMRIGGNS